MKAPKDILTKEFLEEHYIKQRKSVDTIKKELGLRSHNSVTQALKRYGLFRRSLKDSSHILTKEYLEEHYVKQNKSLRTIAYEIGFKRKSIVSKALNTHGITKREHTKSEKLENFWKGRRSHHTISGSFFNAIVNGARQRNLEIMITIDYIWNLFEEQGGKCALSGLELRFNLPGENRNTRTASLDRIDSSKGYIEGNVQWVHRQINKMKMDLDESEFVDFCKAVFIHNNKD
jgi:hypothetical protein